MDYINLQNITLLYVEDDIKVSTELIEILQLYVKKIYHGQNGKEGLELYQKHLPDIILADINMPIMDGLSMAKTILEIDSSAQIIVSSAYNEVEYLHKAIKLGIHYYLSKPIHLNELLTALSSIAKNIITEKELIESRNILEQYKYIVDQNEIVSKADINGNITYVNEKFCKLSGYTQSELIGKNHNVVRHKDTDNELFEDLWTTILSKKEWRGTIVNRAKDGSFYIVDSLIIPILDANENITEFISLRKDVTHRELEKIDIQSDLSTSKTVIVKNKKLINEYEHALQNHTIFCHTDINGLISTASKAFRKLLATGLDIKGKSNFDFLDESEDKVKLRKHIQKSIKHCISWNGTLKYNSMSGKVLYLNSSFIPIVDIMGNVEEVLCFFTDTTDKVNLNYGIINTQREIIYKMGEIGETRSKETGAHVKRVAEYSKLLALKYGLSEEEAEEIKMASPMHDIGKVGIPDNILNKPAKLTPQEFKIMQTHSQIGFDMLHGSHQPLLTTASIISLTHHEKWDGSGYPKGLVGEEIHLYGRITAIADVFDALGHDRVYKKAWPLDNILDFLKDASAKHFDPTLLNLFFENLDDFLKIEKSFEDAIEGV
ncbi:PAS domain S-box protein [Sulfurimonas sp. SAG-AH-194-C21]|nr:HD domain-containing phosphohydrolase [Sulfurimonas sp. SAG-AH-194-C21]MDF1883273.1 PAS domain S-box protein [Sulfurimonas sp. SAG-AH-194-C21]